MKRIIFLWLSMALLSSCAIISKDDSSQESSPNGAPGAAKGPTPSLFCNSRPQMLIAGERYSTTFTQENSTATVNSSLSVGDSLSYLDWGTVTNPDNSSLIYTAPEFIPESRTINLVTNGADVSGKCPLHLLSVGTFGIKDDGETVGLPVSVYALSAPPTTLPDFSALSPSENSLARNIDLVVTPSATTKIEGITDAIQNFAMKFEGVLVVPQAATYQFRLSATAGRPARLYLNDVAIAIAPGQGTISLPTKLAQARHSIRLEYAHTSGPMTLRLEWHTQLTPTTYSPYAVIPATQFDRR